MRSLRRQGRLFCTVGAVVSVNKNGGGQGSNHHFCCCSLLVLRTCHWLCQSLEVCHRTQAPPCGLQDGICKRAQHLRCSPLTLVPSVCRCDFADAFKLMLAYIGLQSWTLHVTGICCTALHIPAVYHLLVCSRSSFLG